MAKNKIFAVSFDDCEDYDIKLCELFRKYNIKATFFLISGELGYVWENYTRMDEVTTIKRVDPEQIKDIYDGFEVAGHGMNHCIDKNNIEGTHLAAQRALSELCGYPVKGMAYPGGIYSRELIEELRKTDTLYARTIVNTYDFSIPKDFLEMTVTCEFKDERMEELLDEFLSYEGDEPILFNIYGHSYDLFQKPDSGVLSRFESFLKKISNRDDVWYAEYREIANAFKK